MRPAGIQIRAEMIRPQRKLGYQIIWATLLLDAVRYDHWSGTQAEMGGPKQQPRAAARRRRGTAGSSGGGTGSVNTKAELGLQVVDYFDYLYGDPGTINDGAVKHYWWNTDQNLFNNNLSGTSGQSESFCRVRRCEVYILPRIPALAYNATTDDPDYDSNAAAMYTCNVQTPALAGHHRPSSSVAIGGALATNVQVTNVLPRIDTTWKKVFACDMQKTFQSSVIRPYYFQNNQCLFSLQLLNPVDGGPYLGLGEQSFKVRVKVVLHIDQPIMPVQKASLYVNSNNDVGTPDLDAAGAAMPTEPELSYCQMDLKQVLHRMS